VYVIGKGSTGREGASSCESRRGGLIGQGSDG